MLKHIRQEISFQKKQEEDYLDLTSLAFTLRKEMFDLLGSMKSTAFFPHTITPALVCQCHIARWWLVLCPSSPTDMLLLCVPDLLVLQPCGSLGIAKCIQVTWIGIFPIGISKCMVCFMFHYEMLDEFIRC